MWLQAPPTQTMPSQHVLILLRENTDNSNCLLFDSQVSVPRTPSGMLQPDAQRKSGRQRYTVDAVHRLTAIPISYCVTVIFCAVFLVRKGPWLWRESTPLLALEEERMEQSKY